MSFGCDGTQSLRPGGLYGQGWPPEKDPLSISAAQVIRLRTARDWSQEQLAGRCKRADWDASRDTIARIEAGIRTVSERDLAHLAQGPELLPEKRQGSPIRSSGTRLGHGRCLSAVPI